MQIPPVQPGESGTDTYTAEAAFGGGDHPSQIATSLVNDHYEASMDGLDLCEMFDLSFCSAPSCFEPVIAGTGADAPMAIQTLCQDPTCRVVSPAPCGAVSCADGSDAFDAGDCNVTKEEQRRMMSRLASKKARERRKLKSENMMQENARLLKQVRMLQSENHALKALLASTLQQLHVPVIGQPGSSRPMTPQGASSTAARDANSSSHNTPRTAVPLGADTHANAHLGGAGHALGGCASGHHVGASSHPLPGSLGGALPQGLTTTLLQGLNTTLPQSMTTTLPQGLNTTLPQSMTTTGLVQAINSSLAMLNGQHGHTHQPHFHLRPTAASPVPPAAHTHTPHFGLHVHHMHHSASADSPT